MCTLLNFNVKILLSKMVTIVLFHTFAILVCETLTLVGSVDQITNL